MGNIHIPQPTKRKTSNLFKHTDVGIDFKCANSLQWGRDSAVGIATRYGLHGPEIESRRGRDFPYPSRPALGPTQPPVQRVPGLCRG